MAAVRPKPASCHREPATAHAPPESSGSSSCPPRASGWQQTCPQATGRSSSPVVWADRFETKSAASLGPVLKTPAPRPVGCSVMPPCGEEQGTREEDQRQVKKRQSPHPSLRAFASSWPILFLSAQQTSALPLPLTPLLRFPQRTGLALVATCGQPCAQRLLHPGARVLRGRPQDDRGCPTAPAPHRLRVQAKVSRALFCSLQSCWVHCWYFKILLPSPSGLAPVCVL